MLASLLNRVKGENCTVVCRSYQSTYLIYLVLMVSNTIVFWILQICHRNLSAAEREEVLYGVHCCWLSGGFCIEWSYQRGNFASTVSYLIIVLYPRIVTSSWMIWMLEFNGSSLYIRANKHNLETVLQWSKTILNKKSGDYVLPTLHFPKFSELLL